MGSTVTGRNPSTVYVKSEGQRFAGDCTLVVVECATCGVTYAIPESFQRSALEYHGDNSNGWKICCPFGHTWWYTGETEVERLKRERDDAHRRSRATRDLLEHEQRSHAATKGHLTRTRRRIAAGVCPCCNRTFQQLARHIKTKHPDYVATGQDGDLPHDVPKTLSLEHAALAFLSVKRRWSEVRDHLGLSDTAAANLLGKLGRERKTERIARGVYRRNENT